MLLKLIRLAPPERFRFSLATFSLNQSVPPADQLPCPLYVFPLKKTYDWNAIKMAKRIRRLIREGNVDIVHTFLESADIWGGLVAKLSGCPILVSSRRDMGYFRSPKHGIGYKVVNRLVDQVQAVSEQVRSFLIENDGLDPQKVVTLHNGIEMEKIAASNGVERLRASIGLQGGATVISTVANIRPVKGLDVLMRAAAIVCREFPQSRFLIAGEIIDREHHEHLMRLVRELGLQENVTFLGRTENVTGLLKLSTMFCMLSRSEGFSNAILEAMATGLPCVVTSVGGNPEAIQDGHSGFLVPSEDERTAAERILALLRDREKARQMGKAARATVEEKFTAAAMVRGWTRQYDMLLASKASQG